MKSLLTLLASTLLLVACGSPSDSSSETSADFTAARLNTRVIGAVGNDRFVKVDFEKLKNIAGISPAQCAENVPADIAQAEKRILDLTNAERQKNGLAALILDACASKVARRHSENMARRNQMDHNLDGKGPAERMRDGGLGFSAVYENIHNWNEYSNNQPVWNTGAYGDHAMDFWRTSPTHRANLLNSSVTHIGIGVAKGQVGNQGLLTGTQNFFRP